MFKYIASLFLYSLLGLVLSQSCKLTDESTGHSYDLNSIRKEIKNWQIKTTDFTYYLNICDFMNSDESYEEYNKCPSFIFACQIDAMNSTVTRSLGNKISYSILDEGEIKVAITGGDKCSNGQQRKTNILLHCDKNKVGTPNFVDEAEKCVYTFEWETSAACPTNAGTISPPTSKDCKVYDSNKQLTFDLTPLSLTQGNWVVKEGEYEYLLNVCGEVHGIRDCSGNGACQIKPSNPEFSNKKLGKPSLPIIENNVLKMKFTGGDSCHAGLYQRETLIIFTCLPGENLGTPKFLEETDECIYIFSWESSAACGEPIEQQCVTTDPATGKKVDLSGLKRKNENWKAISTVANDKSEYYIGICQKLQPGAHKCRDDVSICQNIGESGRSLGTYGELVAQGGQVILKYSDGDLCPGSTQRVSSDIIFTCDPKATNTSPKLISSKSDCQYLFTWTTSHACEQSGDSTSKTNVGAILTTIFFSFLGIYFLLGFAYNRYVRKEKGIYQIPHFTLCQACYYTGKEKFGGTRGIQL